MELKIIWSEFAESVNDEALYRLNALKERRLAKKNQPVKEPLAFE